MGIHSPRREGLTWLRADAIPRFKPGEVAPFEVYTTFDDITGIHTPEAKDKRDDETAARAARGPA
jgi:hypothetical protein